MSKKKKRSASPSLPDPLKDPKPPKNRTTRRDWENFAHTVTKRYRIAEKEKTGHKFLEAAELKGAIEKRRKEAMLNLIDEVYARFSSYGAFTYNTLGEEWIHVNLMFNTYSIIELHSHILTAAAIWILDRIHESKKPHEVYKILPQDDSFLDSMNIIDLWDPKYDEDLIWCVQLLLQERNAPVEKSHDDIFQYITDGKTAQGTHRTDTPSRKAFEQLMALVPEKDKKRAAEHFETLFWDCAARTLDVAEPLLRNIADLQDLHTQASREYNRKYESFRRSTGEWIRTMYDPQEQLKRMPDIIPDLHDFSHSSGIYSGNPFSGSDKTSFQQKTIDAIMELNSIVERIEDLTSKIDSAHKEHFDLMDMISRFGYIEDCSVFGEDVASRMRRLDIGDPFEICFALLYLVEEGSDLPWAYGIGTALMEEVTDSLPWGMFEYDEFDDDIWFGEGGPKTVKVPANASIPDMNKRQYHPRGDDTDFRSIAQLIYEETGCLLPRDMHLYDEKIRRLRRFGVTGKDAAVVLACMSVLGQARRQQMALNYRPGYWEWTESYLEDSEAGKSQPANETADSPEHAKDSEEITKLKNEIKWLRGSLHEAERATRDAEKVLETVKQKAALEHRELADLRELVFYEGKTEEEMSDEEEIPEEFPYTIQKNTVIFGGHPSWDKAIRPLLTGNIRYVEKDMITFDLALVRGADIIWVQTNAMSHKMYYRIIDTARQYKKIVRYFTNASAAKCAAQVAEQDSQRMK